jgi:hypothetical protein
MTGLLTPFHLALLVLVIVLLVSSRRLPQLGRATGEMVRQLSRPGTEPRPSAPARAALTSARGGGVGQRMLLGGLVRVLPRPLAWVVRLLLR